MSKEEIEATASTDGQTKKPRKLWIALGIAVVVLAVLGVAGWKWHEQPTFCSTVCHKVMTPYVESWQSGDLLAATHGKAGVKCLDCHEPTLSQQLSEVGKYVTGSYETPLPFVKIGTKEFCLKCHSSYAKVAEKTANYSGQESVNPHASHQGALDCYKCHSMHGTPTLFCNSCHHLELPEGWTNPTQDIPVK